MIEQAYYSLDDEYYIGENKVPIIDGITEEQINMGLYPYIKKYSIIYYNPEANGEVMDAKNNKKFKLYFC